MLESAKGVVELIRADVPQSRRFALHPRLTRHPEVDASAPIEIGNNSHGVALLFFGTGAR